MEISNQLPFHSSPKSREVKWNKKNKLYTRFLIERMFFIVTWEKSTRQSWKFLWFILLHPAFQFHNLLLKSITNPFIFSIAICVEKMEIWWINNWIIGRRVIQIETNYSNPHKKHNSCERDDSVLFLFRVLFLSFTFSKDSDFLKSDTE